MNDITAHGDFIAAEDDCMNAAEKVPRTTCSIGNQTREVEELKKELLNLKLTNFYLSQRINMSEITSDTDALIAENAKLKASLADKDAILEKARAYIIDTSKNANPFCTSEEQKLQEKINKLTRELNDAQAIISGYETEQNESKRRIEELDEERTELCEKLSVLQHEVQTLRRHRASESAEAQLAFLEAESTKLTETNKQLQCQLLNVEEELNAKRHENETLTNSLNELQETLNTFAGYYQQKSQQLKEIKKGCAKEQNDSLSSSPLENEKSKETIERLCQQLHDDREKLAKAVEVISFYKSKYFQLKREYAITENFTRHVLKKLDVETENSDNTQASSNYRVATRKLDRVLKLAEKSLGHPEKQVHSTETITSLKQLLELATSIYDTNQRKL